MKLRKKRKKDITKKNNINKTLIIIVMLICITIAMITYWIYAYHHKYGSYNFNEIKLVSNKISDYIEVKGNIVYLKNIDEEIIRIFTNNQNNIIKNNDVTSVDIKKNLDKEILSVMITYSINNTKSTYEKVLTINVDLKEDKILNNEELFQLTGITYKDIATNIFDSNIKLPNDYSKKITDAISDEEMTATEFNNNSEKYIIRIREKLPEILNVYIEDNKLYGLVELSEIDKICYYSDINNRLINIKIELGKI